ncbi:hypothetical protein BN946_scf184592.g5 [Trametes cinnabarina]|uniref:F-box domain-containing protein n=1 Tax=Pycnoporus cinnabarinus TaxID=5643 RepID=A0A060SXY0_PYCCI|nr:hypothetical protein BN946_scf184592.g5 [Trametes cinnabarina]
MTRYLAAEQSSRESQVAVPSLPWDILHILFEHASNATLLAYSLMSRTWRDLVRPRLVASVIISESGGDYTEACDDLMNNYPRLTGYIRRLELAHKLQYPTVPKSRPTVTNALLATLIARIPRAEEIRLRAPWIDAVQLQAVAVPPERKLKKLVMIDCAVHGQLSGLIDPRILFNLARTIPANTAHIRLSRLRMQNLAPGVHPALPLLDARSLLIELEYEERSKGLTCQEVQSIWEALSQPEGGSSDWEWEWDSDA